jgi:hypothetical protein
MMILDFFDIEERNGDSGGSSKPAEVKKPAESKPNKPTVATTSSTTTFRVDAAEFVPPVHAWNTFQARKH